MRSEPFVNPTRLAAWVVLIALQVGLGAWFMADRAPQSDAALHGFPLDDAWIHLVYGRSVAESLIPRYNDTAEAGFTSMAWMLVCAVAQWVSWATGLSIGVSLKALGVASGALMSISVFEAVVALGSARPAALVAAALCGATPLLAFSQVSGMEVCLAAGLGVWVITALAREKWLAAGMLLGLAFWTRPEFALQAVVTGIALLVAWRRAAFREHRASLLRVGLSVAIMGVAWCGYCLAVTGRILPNTFYVKFTSAHRWESVVTIVDEILRPMPCNFLGAGALLSAIGVICLFKRPRVAGMVAFLFPIVLLAATAVTRDMKRGAGGGDGGFTELLAAYAAGMPEMHGGYFYWTRYAAPAIPFLFVWFGVGLTALLPARPQAEQAPTADSGLGAAGAPPSRQKHASHRGPVFAARWLAAIILIMIAGRQYPQKLAERRDEFAWNCDNIEKAQVAIGKWVNENVPQDQAVCVNDAGAIRYFGRRRTIDLEGLNAHDLAFDRATLVRVRSSVDELRKFMKARGATYLIIFPSWFSQLFASPEIEIRFDLVRNFTVERYTVSPGQQQTTVVLRLR